MSDKVFQFKYLNQFKKLKQAVFSSYFGNIDFRFGSQSSVLANRKNIFKKLNIKDSWVYEVEQVHGSDIQVLTKQSLKNTKGSLFYFKDGLLTSLKNTFLMIRTADCYPVLFFDPAKQAVAIAHAGWKGLVQKIHLNMLFKMQSLYQSRIKDILVFIGPGIGPCCFLKSDPLQINLPDWQKFINKKGGRYRIDLTSFLKNDLKKAGVRKENIFSLNICTSCSQEFFSHVRSRKTGEQQARFASIIGLVN
jgi:polyphenol oxidase